MAAARGAHSSTGQRRDFNQMERVRLRAARMFEQGTSQAEVAHRLHTSGQNAHRWHRRWQQGGRAALRAAGRAGRRPKLDSRQRRRVERALGQGALAHGFDSDLWTLPAGRAGHRASHRRPPPSSQVWRILRSMGWTLQRPQRRASERDEEAIAGWVQQDWPRIRQKRAAARRVAGLPG
jgi:transposase